MWGWREMEGDGVEMKGDGGGWRVKDDRSWSGRGRWSAWG